MKVKEVGTLVCREQWKVFDREIDLVKGSDKPTILLLRLCRAMPSADQLDVLVLVFFILTSKQ
jgi:hypothetical protein